MINGSSIARLLFRHLHFTHTTLFTIVISILIACITAPTAIAITSEEMLSDPVLEQRARDLSKQLRCLVCQNQSIDDSDADLARDLRIEVRSQITKGETDGIILEKLRQKYGDYVLLNPPLDQGTLFLWVAPFGFIGVGIIIVMLARKQRANPRKANLNAADQTLIKKMVANRNHDNENKQT